MDKEYRKLIHGRIMEYVPALCRDNKSLFVMSGDVALVEMFGLNKLVSDAVIDVSEERQDIVCSNALNNVYAWSVGKPFTVTVIINAGCRISLEVVFSDGVRFALTINFIEKIKDMRNTFHKKGIWCYSLDELLIDKLIQYRFMHSRDIAYEVISLVTGQHIISDYTMAMISQYFGDRRRLIKETNEGCHVIECDTTEESLLEIYPMFKDRLRECGVNYN